MDTINYLGILDTAPENPKEQDCYRDRQDQVWIYVDGEWKLYQDFTGNIDTGLTEYEINKMVVAQLPSMTTEEQLASAKDILIDYFDKEEYQTGYFMLLNHELRYFTVFHRHFDDTAPLIEREIIDCLLEMGVIQMIDYDNSGNNIECWIKNEKGTFMFLLFNYDWGVLECQ